MQDGVRILIRIIVVCYRRAPTQYWHSPVIRYNNAYQQSVGQRISPVLWGLLPAFRRRNSRRLCSLLDEHVVAAVGEVAHRDAEIKPKRPDERHGPTCSSTDPFEDFPTLLADYCKLVRPALLYVLNGGLVGPTLTHYGYGRCWN